ncbi:uncharacterized protein LOC144907673 isoform X1 [Branchiostoma floridae x Branchiostoma belcheri]
MANTLRSTFLATAALVVLLAFFTGTSAQTSAAPSTAAAGGSTAAPTTPPMTKMRYEVVMVFEASSIWAIILMLTILVADACLSYGVVKHVASIGPLFGMLIAGAALTMAPLLGGSSRQEGFNTIMIQGSIVAALFFFAAFGGFKSKKYIGTADCKAGRDLPYTTLSLLCSCGVMPAISGTITAATNVTPGYQWPGMIMGSICVGLMTSNMIWYITRAVTAKNRVARVAETANNVSMTAK